MEGAMKGLIEKLNDFLGQIMIDTAQVRVWVAVFRVLVRMRIRHVRHARERETRREHVLV
jgi:hypothetical protein